MVNSISADIGSALHPASDTAATAKAAEHRALWRNAGDAGGEQTWCILVGLVNPEATKDGGPSYCPTCGAKGRAQLAITPYGEPVRATNVQGCVFSECAVDPEWPAGVTVWIDGGIVFQRGPAVSMGSRK